MSKRQKYFLKQKLFGIGLIAIGILLMILSGDGSATIIIFPIGLMLIFSKKMCIIDDYSTNMKTKRRGS